MGQNYTLTKTASTNQCAPGTWVHYEITVTCTVANPVPSTVQVIDQPLTNIFYFPSLISNDFTLVSNNGNPRLESQFISFSSPGVVTLSYDIMVWLVSAQGGSPFFRGCPMQEDAVNAALLFGGEGIVPLASDTDTVHVFDAGILGGNALFAQTGTVAQVLGTIPPIMLTSVQNEWFSIGNPPGSGIPAGTGVLEIDHDTDWTGCSIWITEGIAIRVHPGITLTITDCEFFACDMMWRGITVEGGGRLIMEGSTIRQADHAVTLLDQSDVLLRNSIFTACHDGVYAPPAFPVLNQVALGVRDCRFEGLGPFLPAYPGQTDIPNNFDPNTLAGGVGFAGIRLNDLASNVWIADCEFLKLEEGLRAERTNLDCFRNHFHDMFDGDYGIPVMQRQAGVYASGMEPQNPLNVAGSFRLNITGGSLNASEDFFKCTTGIAVGGMNVDARENRISDCRAGFYAANCDNAEVLFHDNLVLRCNEGVSLWENSLATRTIIANNQIFWTRGSGVFAADGGGGNWTDFQITDNWLGLEQGTGIRIGAVGQANITRNFIQVLAGPYPVRGILLRAAPLANVSCNKVTGGVPVAPPAAAATFGLDSQLSDDVSFACNETQGLFFGFHFTGPCFHNTITGNTLTDHGVGLWCSATTTFGLQSPLWEDFGNNFPTWGSLPTWFSAAHMGVTSVVSQNTFFMPNLPNPANVLVPNAGFLDFFDFNIGGTAFPSCQDDFCPQVAIKPIREDGLGSLDEQIAGGTLSYPVYEAENRWLGRRFLYRRLAADSSLWQGDSLMSAFLAQVQGGSEVGFEQLRHDHNRYLTGDSTGQAVADSLRQVIGLAMEQLRLSDSLWRQGGSPSDSLALLAARGSLHTAMWQFRNWAGARQADRLAQTQSLLTLNGQIPVGETYEQNERAVNEVYLRLRTEGRKALTQAERQSLEGIIFQCPLSGGYAVLRARELYGHYVNPQQAYDDSSHCADGGLQWRKMNGELSRDIVIYPNPASDEIRIRYTGSHENKKILILNLNGQMLREGYLKPGSQETRVDVSDLAGGVYIVMVGNESFKLFIK